jgi:alkyl sulfatase BDS1-like metallo-beta-lactamase superfamily hydrolase
MAMDAQRQYSETLFNKSRARIEELAAQFEEKAKAKPPVSLPEANKRALDLLKAELIKLFENYYRVVGLDVESVRFYRSEKSTIVVKLE